MGIIIKQSIKGSIWSYMGLIVGYINVGIIMPAFFLVEQIGLVHLFIALSTIFSNFSTLGFSSVITRLFPEFRDKSKNHNGFLFLLLSTALLGFALSLAAFIIFKPHIISANIEKSPLLVEYIFLLIPLLFFRILFRLLETYNKVLYDAVTGTFWNDFVHKLVNLILIILFALEIVNFRQFFFGYIVSLCMPVIPIIIVLIQRNEFIPVPKLNFLKPALRKEMIIVAAFGLLNGFSGTLTNNIDKLLINRYLSLQEVGIFSVCALFASVIMVPSRSTVNIATGIIAQAWKNNNIKHIKEIYVKASLNQTIIGALILIGIIINLDNIFNILPQVYNEGEWVIVYYSLGVFVMVSSTTSATILATSKHFRSLSIIIVLQIVLTVLMHVLLIPIWGITGAAFSVFLTYLFRSIALVGYIKIKFGLFCYNLKHIWVLFFAILSFLIAYIVPDIDVLVVNILVKSGVVIVVYCTLILASGVSEDLNILFQKVLQFVKKILLK